MFETLAQSFALQEWLSLLFRWAHIVAAISWIGGSFYFMWLDSSLKRRDQTPEGVRGENWTVHGGGFYHTQKYMVAPEAMPDDLHWFRWESYFTWLTGFLLLSVIYYWGASSFLIDSSKVDLQPWQAIGLSLAGLAGAWLLYNVLCASPLKTRPSALFAVLFAGLMAATWAYSQIFTDRAAFIQVGAMIATIMSGNVFLTIIPNQRIVVADLQAGRTPDAKYGAIAKLRSTHNNYLTLPVIFLMISNHYPMTFGHDWNWVVVGFVLLLGAVVRDWFNRHEAGQTGRAVAFHWPAAAVLTTALIAFTAWRPGAEAHAGLAPPTAVEAQALVAVHCATCHAAAPTHPWFDEAPGGVALETLEEIRRHAQSILAQAVLTDAMPLGNETDMTEADRAALGAWIRAGGPD